MAAVTAPPLLSTFQKHIEDMRNLVLCKICIKPLYEPYILACGHTYCYTCLSSWFGGAENRRKRKNCPDCRAHVYTMPSPNYLLRDLVHMFISRAELLPEDETTEEHQESKEAEAAILATDRVSQGLFRGVFSRGIVPHPHQNIDLPTGEYGRPIRDHEDNVDRCPNCAWELEDGICIHCGYDLGEYSDSDVNSTDSGQDHSIAGRSVLTISSDVDGDMSPIDHFDGHHLEHHDDVSTQYDDSDEDEDDVDLPRSVRYGYNFQESPSGNPIRMRPTTTSDEDEDEDDDMSDFIDDNENDGERGYRRRTHRSYGGADLDSETDQSEVTARYDSPSANSSARSSGRSSSAGGESAADTPVPTRKVARRPARRIDSDESESDGPSSSALEREQVHPATDDDDDDDDDDTSSDEDEDEEMSVVATATQSRTTDGRGYHVNAQRSRRGGGRFPNRERPQSGPISRGGHYIGGGGARSTRLRGRIAA